MVTITYVLELIRDAIWPAFTGGCHYDVTQTDFSNIFHVYLWAVLAAIPIAIHLAVPPSSSWIAWLSYSVVVGTFFICSKIVASLLHWMLDTYAVQERRSSDEEAQQLSDSEKVHRRRNRELFSSRDRRDSESLARLAPAIELVELNLQQRNTSSQSNPNNNNNDETLSTGAAGGTDANNTVLEMSSVHSLAVAEVHTDGSTVPASTKNSTQRNLAAGRRRPPSYALQHILARLPSRSTLRRAHSLVDTSGKPPATSSSLLPRRRVIIAETRLDDVSFLKEPVASSSPSGPGASSAEGHCNTFFRTAPNLPPSMRLHHRMWLPHETALSQPTLDEPFSDTEIGGTSLQALPLLPLRSPSADSTTLENIATSTGKEGPSQDQHFVRINKVTAQSTPFLPAGPAEGRQNQSVSSTVVLGLNRRLDDSIGALDFVKSESQMVDIARFSQTNLPLEIQRELLHRDRGIYGQERQKTSSSIAQEQDDVADDETATSALNRTSNSQFDDEISVKWLFENEEENTNQQSHALQPRTHHHRHVRRPSLRAQLADLRTLLGELRLADPESQETDLELHELHRRLERLQRQHESVRHHMRNSDSGVPVAATRLRISSSLPNDDDSPSSSSTVNVSAGDRDSASTPNSFLLNAERSGNDGNEPFTRLVARGGAPRFSSFERLVTGLLTRQGTLAGQPVRAPANRLTSSTSALSTNVRHRRRVTCRIDRGRLKFDLLLHFDRLSLLAFMDTTRSVWEIFVMGLLAAACSFLAGQLLAAGFFRDFEFLLLVVVLASSQFSLFKSVQPDPASPVHGFNPLTPYTRPVFFCLASLMLLSTSWIQSESPGSIVIWGLSLPPPVWLLNGIASVLRILILSFPILFALGIFAQLNTATLCFLEQVNIHVFGGSGLGSLVGGLASLARSIISASILVPFAYLTLTDREAERSVWLAVFCAICVPLSYHLSRQPSEVPSIFSLVIASCRRSLKAKRRKTSVDNRANQAVECDQSERLPLNASGDQQSESNPLAGKDGEEDDPLFEQMRSTVVSRLRADVFVALVVGALVFSLQVSTLLSTRSSRPPLLTTLIYLEAMLGLFLHYILPELRHELPWRFVASPILRSSWTPYAACVRPPPLTPYERLYAILTFFERNVLLVCLLMGAVNTAVSPTNWVSANNSSGGSSTYLAEKFTPVGGAILLSLFTLRAFRQAYAVTGHQWVLILFTHLLFTYDLAHSASIRSETLLFDLFLTSFCYYRLRELALKTHFVVVYSAPWQVSWGSVCHALFHPLSLPHSALLLGQTVLASLISAPVQPFMGSVIFLMSYPRPLKFWERTYYTRRLDNSNTRLASQLQSVGDRGPTASQTDTPDNLNSVFYEQLAMSLRRHLAGDCLILGRWGEVSAGDCFILASDHLNALVHIVEIGNGLVTFQLRGLELRGTYCQQRELEAICEWPGSDRSFCCCNPGRLPNFLSFNATFQQRWLAWRVVASKYVLPGYSVAETPAHTLLDSHDLKRLFLSHYVRSLIFYALQSNRLDAWLSSEAVQSTIATVLSEPHNKYCDLDMSFAPPVSDDYDVLLGGVSLRRFSDRYSSFVRECIARRNSRLDQVSQPQQSSSSEGPNDQQGACSSSSQPRCHNDVAPANSLSHQSEHSTLSDTTLPESHRRLIAFSFMLGVVGRRLLATAARGSLTTTEFLLHGIHAMLKGDLRLTAARDDWVLADVELLQRVIAPSIRLAIRLLQEYFVSGGSEDSDPGSIYNMMDGLDRDTTGLISHEADPQWRSSILAGRSSMTALRQIQDDAAMDDFRLISLRYTQLAFRLVKVNSECVRGLWAGQQQELVFYRNRNPERGSIQNARQVLRNMINSSCDQPLGYPIFVSPLLTSLASDHPLVANTIGPELDFSHVLSAIRDLCRRIRVRCGLALLNSSSPQCSAPHLVPATVPKPDIGIELQPPFQQQQGEAASCEATSCV